MKKSWLNEKTVVLTGVTSGIGKLLAKKLIEKHGCKILGIGRNEKAVEEFKKELKEKSNLLVPYLFDVSKEENWKNFAKELEEKNIQIDVLINNAGQLPKFKNFERYECEDFENIMKVNFMASVYSCKHLLPLLHNSNNPAIINVSSSASLCPLAGTSVYSSSKAALKSFTECLQEDLRKKVYVAIVCPGFTKTEIFRNQNVEVDKIVDKFCSSCEKNTNRILKKIEKKKKRIVVGFDAHLMDGFYRHFPRTFSHTCSSVLKKSKIKLFAEVWNNKKDQ